MLLELIRERLLCQDTYTDSIKDGAPWKWKYPTIAAGRNPDNLNSTLPNGRPSNKDPSCSAASSAKRPQRLGSAEGAILRPARGDGKTPSGMKQRVSVGLESRLLTVRQLAVYLGESESALRTMLKRNQIPASCILRMPGRAGTDPKTGKPFKGRKLRFEKAAIDDWLESCRQQAEPA